jgi:hypothetical protein
MAMRSVLGIVTILVTCFVLFDGGGAYAKVVNAGPIHNNTDAQTKCPQACGRHMWDGNWWTKGFTPYCSCGGKTGGQPAAVAPAGPGPSCSADPTEGCPGCSVSCPTGREAHCTQGQDTTGTPMCWTQPVCQCR